MDCRYCCLALRMTKTYRFALSPLLRPLKECYPYKFHQPPCYVEQSLYEEWLPVFEALCADLDALIGADSRGCYGGNLKEKFGEPRWRPCYTHGLDEPNQCKLYELIRTVQDRAQV